MLKRLLNSRWGFVFREVGPLIALLAIISGIWAFSELADEVMEGDTKRFDHWALESLRNPDNPADPLGPHWLEEVGRDVTALGGHVVLTLVVLGVALFLLLQRACHAMWLIIAASLGGMLLSGGLKRLLGLVAGERTG